MVSRMTAVPRQVGLVRPNPTSQREVRRADIQGLRAIAVLFVITFHSVGFFRAGFIGVDMFFVVSGFVITNRLLSDAERTGTVSLARFYGRRFQRIAPAAFVTLSSVAIAATLLLPQPRRASVYLDTLWAAMGAGNFRMILMPSERTGGVHLVSPVVHFWSLGVEEQFYLVWPLLLLLAWMVGRRHGAPHRWVFWTALTASGVSLLIGAWSTSVDAGAAYLSPVARAWQLGVGALLAILTPQLERLAPRFRSMLAFGGLAAIELAVVSWTQEMYPVPGGLLPVAGAAALIAAGTGGTPLVNQLLGTRALRRIGDLSYSLYLWHFPVFFFMLIAQPSGGWDVVIESLVLTALLSWLSYRFVERPVLRLFRQHRGPDSAVEAGSPLPTFLPPLASLVRPAVHTPGRNEEPVGGP